MGVLWERVSKDLQKNWHVCHCFTIVQYYNTLFVKVVLNAIILNFSLNFKKILVVLNSELRLLIEKR